MNVKIAMEKIKQQLDWTFIPKIITPALLGTLLAIALNTGKEIQRIQGLTFDSQEQKAEVLKVAEEHLSEVEIYKGFARIRELEEKQEEIRSEISLIKSALVRIEKNM